ncbi:MAG: aminotransferase class V-fold PLP-dependent enzyme [Christensenellales bacterium]
MIYMDNSASSFYKPRCVINAVSNALSFITGNPGRSGHGMAMRGAALVLAAREKCSAFFGLKDSGGMIFTDNCSGALNLAILGSVRRGGHVVTTALEHNSVLRPLYELKRRGEITLSVAMPSESGAVGADAVERLIRPETYMVITNHVSNVTGAIAPVAEIGKICRQKGILYLVDAAQSAGYLDIEMDSQNIDLLAVAPHKGLHGPQGVGLLAIGERAQRQIKPIRYGGTGTASHELKQPEDLPEGLETGTLPTPAIAGLCAAIDWCKRESLKNREIMHRLGIKLRRGLKNIPRVRILSPDSALNGLISFNVTGMPSESVGDILSGQYDICVRAGLHCAPLIHEAMGTLKTGAVRVSLGCDNTENEIDFFLKAVHEIAAEI